MIDSSKAGTSPPNVWWKQAALLKRNERTISLVRRAPMTNRSEHCSWGSATAIFSIRFSRMHRLVVFSRTSRSVLIYRGDIGLVAGKTFFPWTCNNWSPLFHFNLLVSVSFPWKSCASPSPNHNWHSFFASETLLIGSDCSIVFFLRGLILDGWIHCNDFRRLVKEQREKQSDWIHWSEDWRKREWTPLICFISILRWSNDWRRRFTGLTRLEKILTSTDQKRTSDNPSTRETPRDDRDVHPTHIPRRRILSPILEMSLAVDPKETEERDLFHP